MYLRKSLHNLLKQIPSEYSGDFGILICGETGTGKEVLAKEIHKRLKIRGEFVAVDLMLLPQSLFEAELFGYKKGAFTGANEDKRGLLEIANNGTLFLDEISNLHPDSQAKLLRVLETKRFRRIGEIKERKSEFFLISATNKDLIQLIKEGKFREDLYYRISHFVLKITPLREEKDEIMNLINEFLGEKSKKFKFTKRALEFILCYPWYGNVRELKNFCIYLRNLKEKDLIDINDFPEHILERWCQNIKMERDKPLAEMIECFKRNIIVNYLQNGGNLKSLSRELGKSEVQVRRILKKLKIDIKNFKNDKKG